jgi:hypothetical protein
MHTQFCGGPFTTSPTAFVGPNANSAPSCPAPNPQMRRAPGVGTWLHPSSGPVLGRRVITPAGVALAAYAGSVNPPMSIYWLRNVEIDIGSGTDPAVARAIFASIHYAPSTPDTPAALACERQPHPERMPKPERLATTLRLLRGQITLEPPQPRDHTTVTPGALWKRLGPKSNFEKYQIILARYSSLYPQQPGPNGYVPSNEKVLTWVVYSTPLSPHLAGCGGWALDAFDASDGKDVAAQAWAPGP